MYYIKVLLPLPSWPFTELPGHIICMERAGAHPTNNISIGFEIRKKFEVL